MSEPTTTTRIDHAVTSGTFSLDGQTYEVDNNVWVVGDDAECVVIDAPHDTAAIIELVGDRRLMAIVCTHAHDDHVRVAPAVCGRPRGADPAAPGRPRRLGAHPRRAARTAGSPTAS